MTLHDDEPTAREPGGFTRVPGLLPRLEWPFCPTLADGTPDWRRLLAERCLSTVH